MILKEINTFSPSKHAYFVNTKIPVIQWHPSLDYLAFTTRANELILYNNRTGRSSILYKSQHQLLDIKFTSCFNTTPLLPQQTSLSPSTKLSSSNDLLLAIQKTTHQILCFSLKTQKLKKTISGSRLPLQKLQYNYKHGLIASMCQQSLSIYNQSTLTRQKLLKCSTSTFNDCLFTRNGRYLLTSFKDGTVIVWEMGEGYGGSQGNLVSSYNKRQYQLEQMQKGGNGGGDGGGVKVAASYSMFVVAYNQQQLMMANLLRKQLIFQKIDKFWTSPIVKVDFISNNVIVIQTQTTFYLAQVLNQNNSKILITNIKAIQQKINTFRITGYSQYIMMVRQNGKKVSTYKVVDENKKYLNTKITNPLKNQAISCCGGYSNQDNGCSVKNNINITEINGVDKVNPYQLISNIYHQNQQQVNGITSFTSTSSSSPFTPQKLQQFLLKHHILPDKHRASAYKYLLGLPISPEHFLRLQQKGLHQCTQFLHKRYPLENPKVASTTKHIISYLSHTDPIFAELQCLPQIIFPFVLLFGQDQFLCFEVVYRVLTHWLSFLYEEFPVANSKLLQNIYEILQKQDQELINYLKYKNIAFTKLMWGFLSNFFTTNLPKQAFLAMVDSLVCRPNQPQFVMWVVLGYVQYNRARIMSLRSQQDLDRFLQQQHTVNTAKFMNHVYLYHNKYGPNNYSANISKHVTYSFQTFNFQTQRQYLPMQHYPKDAVLMYRNRRKLLFQEYRKEDQSQLYHDKLSKQMEKLTLHAKRNSQRQMIMAQSFTYHVENEAKFKGQLMEAGGYKGVVPSGDISSSNINHKLKQRIQKIKRLEKLIEQLSRALKNQKQAKSTYKQAISISHSTNLHDQSDRQLQQLQLKLLKQLTSMKPSSLNKPFKSLPVSVWKQFTKNHNRSGSGTQSQENAFKAMMNAQITNKMWEIDSLDNQKNQKMWENQMMKSMKA